MAQFRPNLLITDDYGSAGAVTACHRNGKRFLRQRICPVFSGTSDQLAASSVHLRALLAWRSHPHEEQLRWESFARDVEPHRPPFDHLDRISSNNLFISAYHGFATLGREHVPTPVPFEAFSCQYSGSQRCSRDAADSVEAGDGRLRRPLPASHQGSTRPARSRMEYRRPAELSGGRDRKRRSSDHEHTGLRVSL